MPNAFTGQLNSNEIFAAIYNMIISQQVFSDNINGASTELVNRFRTDGTLYGDTKLYYATDALKSVPWGNDSEAGNLLSLDRPAAPSVQKITIDKFRQIRLTVDNYLSKRAWSTEGAFSSFNSVMLGWIGDTKKVYDITLFNAFVGTVEGASNTKLVEVPITTVVGQATGEEKNRLEAEAIAQEIANLMVAMKDVSRDFNDYKYLRAYNPSDLLVIWNSKWVNKIKKIDLPTIFHKDGLMDKFEDVVLPARYWGHVNTSTILDGRVYNASTNPDGDVTKAGSTYTVKVAGALRSLIETEITVSETAYHLFPGDALPVGTTIAASSANIAIADTYAECPDIICKVIHKNSFVYMSAFEVATEFFNPRSLTENHYLTFGYAHPEYLANYPLVTLEAD